MVLRERANCKETSGVEWRINVILIDNNVT